MEKKYPIDRISSSFQKFVKQEKSGGILLGISVLIAVILANSNWSEYYFHFFEHKIGFQWNGISFFNFTLHHWINDGLMSIFFFVVGLELKKEIVGGELSNPKNAILPIGAAIGGMLLPAIIYLIFNPQGEAHSGWGIPMATDIAFALGILYLLGNKIPFSLKIFLTALAIVDDLGAVLVIAFFYTSDISGTSLLIGLGFILIMYLGNKIGIRNVWFYAVLGILGVWSAFLLSGVHATIASVLAAFTIPCDMNIKEQTYLTKINHYLSQFQKIDADNSIPILTNDQLHLLEEIKKTTHQTIPPLQNLVHVMHPFVTFFIIPIFALANAGVAIDMNIDELFSTNVTLGVALGLLIGKVTGIMGFTLILKKLRFASFPRGMNVKNLFGISLLGSIGFTMSLFITSLAFSNELHINQAKIGIFAASILGGIFGYLVLRKESKDDV